MVPSDLYFYDDSIKLNYSVSVNGKKVDGQIDNGYLTIDRKWKRVII